MGIKVQAFRAGYYGQYREPGDQFEIADEHAYHDSWMEKVDKNGRAIPNKNAPRPGVQAMSTGHNPATGPTKDITSDLV